MGYILARLNHNEARYKWCRAEDCLQAKSQITPPLTVTEDSLRHLNDSSNYCQNAAILAFAKAAAFSEAAAKQERRRSEASAASVGGGGGAGEGGCVVSPAPPASATYPSCPNTHVLLTVRDAFTLVSPERTSTGTRKKGCLSFLPIWRSVQLGEKTKAKNQGPLREGKGPERR